MTDVWIAGLVACLPAKFRIFGRLFAVFLVEILRLKFVWFCCPALHGGAFRAWWWSEGHRRSADTPPDKVLVVYHPSAVRFITRSPARLFSSLAYSQPRYNKLAKIGFGPNQKKISTGIARCVAAVFIAYMWNRFSKLSAYEVIHRYLEVFLHGTKREGVSLERCCALLYVGIVEF